MGIQSRQDRKLHTRIHGNCMYTALAYPYMGEYGGSALTDERKAGPTLLQRISDI